MTKRNYPSRSRTYRAYPEGDAESGAGDQTVTPSSIQSAEAFGTLEIGFFQTVAPDSIASAESFGSPTVEAEEPAFILDQITSSTVSGAWSVSRRLKESYTGALIRVQRASDSTQSDIGYDAGTNSLDAAALATFCGASVGRVVSAYDQTGNSRTLSVIDIDNAPVIWDGAALVTEGVNNVPAMDLAGDGDIADDDGDGLKREDSCGISGTDGVWVAVNSRSDAKAAECGIFSVGDIPSGSTPRGIALTNETVAGPTHRVLVSCQVGTTHTYTDPGAVTWGYYIMEQPASGDNSDNVVERNGASLTETVAGASDAFAINSGRTVWGAMLFSNPWFSFDGALSTAILGEGALDPADKAALEAFFTEEL